MGQKRLGSSRWRSQGEVAARSVDGGAYGATSLPLHHSLREQSPSPSLRDREDRQRPLATPKRTLRTILSASTLRSADLGNLPGPVADHIARPGAALRRFVLAIVEPAFLERQAAAADAPVEQPARSRQRRDPRAHPRPPPGAGPSGRT